MVHYVWDIYNFNPTPAKEEEIYIDVPVFEQNPIPNEILIHMDNEDIKPSAKNQYEELLRIPKAERELFKKNGVLVSGQQKILDVLRNDMETKEDLICRSWTPRSIQLSYILNLGWKYLLKSTETTTPMTIKKLCYVTFSYWLNQNINVLVQENFKYLRSLPKYLNLPDKDLRNEAIRDSFNILRHWLQYKVPKWLRVVNELQKFVCEEAGVSPGNYTFYANQIENDFIPDHLAILYELGVPNTAIKKLEWVVNTNISEEELLIKLPQIIRNNHVELLDYEIDKIKEAI